MPGQDCANSQQSTQMLQKFGRLFRHHVDLIYQLEDEQTLAECYMTLIAPLRNLPNVELLDITLVYCRFDVRRNVNILDNNLTQTIEMNRCPKIDSLKFLIANKFVPSQIFEEVVQQNCHIEGLRVTLDYARLLRFNFSMSLPNLTYLNVTLKLYEDLEQIKRFGKNWKLQRFSCDFRYFMDLSIWVEIFQMIRDNWGNTLEQLSLSFPRNGRWPLVASICELVLDITIDLRLEGMKKLETVQIYSDCAMSLDFLLPISETLKNICVRQEGLHMYRNRGNPNCYSAKQREIIDLIGKEEELTDSNIWKLFPNLQSYQSGRGFIDRPGNK